MNSDEHAPRGGQHSQNPAQYQGPVDMGVAAQLEAMWVLHEQGRDQIDMNRYEAETESAWQAHEAKMLPETEEQRDLSRLFAAIVRMRVDSGTAMPVASEDFIIAPKAAELKPYTTMTRYQLERALSRLSLHKLRNAENRAVEVAADPQSALRMGRNEGKRRTASPRVHVPWHQSVPPGLYKEATSSAYTTWQDICHTYRGPLSIRPYSYDPEGRPEDWGSFYHPELDVFSRKYGIWSKHTSGEQLQEHIITPEALPHLKPGQSIRDIVDRLPIGTPYLAVTGAREFTKGRAGVAAGPVAAETQTLIRPETVLLNLIMLRSLRADGRATGERWLSRTLDWPEDLLNIHLFNLIEKVTVGSGVLARTDIGNHRHYHITPDTFAINARSGSRLITS